MKNLILTISFIVFSQTTLATTEPDLKHAREQVQHKNYKKAIKHYASFIKDFNGNSNDLKSVYFEMANCYFRLNDEEMAIQIIKYSITNLGVTLDDLAGAESLDDKLFEISWENINTDYETLKSKYEKMIKI